MGQEAKRVALITGGAAGLGRATAIALRDIGYAPVVVDLPGALEQLEVDGIARVGADVTVPADVEAAVGAAAELGRLAVGVNCAGIGIAGRTARRGVPLSLDDFKRVVEVNLVGTFNVVRLVAAQMQRHDEVDGERGVIVNTASIAAFEGQIGQVAYSASKGGIVGMTVPIARDLAESRIRCVTIAPGIFDTALLGSVPEEIRQALGASVPHPARLGEPAEYAALVAHIVQNPMINGETIRLDGALRMAPR